MATPSAPFFMRPRTVLREIDTTEHLQADVSSIGCVTGEFRKGPMTPTYTSGSLERFRKLYGSASDPTLSYAHDTCSLFLFESSNLLVNRVTNGAAYAATDIMLDKDTIYGDRLLYVPHSIGSLDDYETGSAHASGIVLLKFYGTNPDFVLANSFTMDISDGATVQSPVVAHAGDHKSTIEAISVAIQSALNTFGSGGTATVYEEPSSVNAPWYTVIIKPPSDAVLTFANAAVTGGVTQPDSTLLQSADNWFGTVVAENPGAWGNNTGVKLTSVDPGVRQRYRLTFSSTLITGNNFSISANDVNVGPVAFNTDSDTTLADIATALKANAHIQDAYVETVTGTVDNDRSIIIVAQTPGDGSLVLRYQQVTGGATQAAILVEQTLTGQASDGSFVIEVYDRSAPYYPTERFQVTAFPQTDGRGEQMNYATRLNETDVGSYNIRLVLNPNLTTEAGFAPMLVELLEPTLSIPTTVAYLGGGSDGSSTLTSQLVSALAVLEDRTRYPVAMMLNAGYTDITYQKALTALSELRNDCFTILDMPTANQATGIAARDYRLYDLDIDSSHAAIYTPDVMISDLTTAERRYVPPSGVVGSAFVYNDKVANMWSAPAGVNRGRTKQVIGLRYHYSPAEEELMFPNQVNYILDKPGYGPTINSQETLQVKNSARRSIHIRRLLSLLETTITDGMETVYHENNDDFTRYNVTQLCETVLSPVHRSRGLYDYRIQCDDVNNTAEIIDADALALTVYVKPVRSIKGVLLNMVITRTGVSFTEIEGQLFNNAQLA